MTKGNTEIIIVAATLWSQLFLASHSKIIMYRQYIFLSSTLFISLLVLFSCLSCKRKNVNESKTIVDTTINENTINTIAQEESNVLKGTTILRASEKNMESGALHGLVLDEIKSSECLTDYSETPTATEISSINQTDDTTLIITAKINANCGYNFLGEIEIVTGNTINLIYHGYGGYAACNCCFGLTYKINLLKNDEYRFDELKFVTLNGHVKTKLPKLK